MALVAPALPASTVPVTNTSGQRAVAWIVGGTITFVFVNGVQVGTSAGGYAVPPGGTISITYSAAPTWTWINPVNESGNPFSYGYNSDGEALPGTEVPYAVHATGGLAGLAAAVSN